MGFYSGSGKAPAIKEHNYFVYILTNDRRSVMYIGVTNNILRRVNEHKNGVCDGFTKRYHVHKLVYYEHYQDVHYAIAREKDKRLDARKEKRAGVLCQPGLA